MSMIFHLLFIHSSIPAYDSRELIQQVAELVISEEDLNDSESTSFINSEKEHHSNKQKATEIEITAAEGEPTIMLHISLA